MKNTIRTILIGSALITSFALSGCGGGGGSGGVQNSGVTFPPASLSNLPVANSGNSYSLIEDTYGLQNATFMSATGGNGSLVLRAAIAKSMTDPNFTSVFRIDISQPCGNSTYYLGGNGPQFPGHIDFYNGHQSSLLNTISGSITFTSFGANSGDVVAGRFAVLVEDQNSATRPVYSVKGEFNFVLNTYGLLVPTPSPVPVAASGIFNTNCVSCHTLGSFGLTELALKGGEINDKFADLPQHKDITLTGDEMKDLKILLNSY